MDRVFKRIELLANLAILFVAVLLCFVLVRQFVLTPQPPAARRAAQGTTLATGTKLSLPGLDWRQNKQTLLVILQKGCRFCTESAPFYQRLVRETAGRADLRLVALLPQEVADGRGYLTELGVPIEDVRQSPPSAVGAAGTPTLALVNADGVVTNVWVGMLAPERETEVLARLQT